jgi:hypothetical protein
MLASLAPHSATFYTAAPGSPIRVSFAGQLKEIGRLGVFLAKLGPVLN